MSHEEPNVRGVWTQSLVPGPLHAKQAKLSGCCAALLLCSLLLVLCLVAYTASIIESKLRYASREGALDCPGASSGAKARDERRARTRKKKGLFARPNGFALCIRGKLEAYLTSSDKR